MRPAAIIVLTLSLSGLACGGGEGGTGPQLSPPPPPPPPPSVPVPPLVTRLEVPAAYGLHDTFVRDGLAFLCVWNTGVMILDVGRVGSPANPQVLTTFKPTNGSLSSPAIHNAWWFHNPVTGEKRYLFLGQEGPMQVGSSSSGDIKVLDVAGPGAPIEVAYYTPPGAGAHNFWMDEARQVLYAAIYNGGVVALDVSGTLTGNLANREIARRQYDPQGNTYAWGVMLSGGHLYASDMLTGLWELDPTTLATVGGGNNVPDRFGSDLWVDGDYAYTGTWGGLPRHLRSGDAVKIWKLSANGGPTLADSIVVPSVGTVSDIQVSDDGKLLVFSAEGLGGGLYVYRLRNPDQPEKVAFAPSSNGIHTATIARLAGKLYAFAASNPASPALLIYDLSPYDQ